MVSCPLWPAPAPSSSSLSLFSSAGLFCQMPALVVSGKQNNKINQCYRKQIFLMHDVNLLNTWIDNESKLFNPNQPIIYYQKNIKHEQNFLRIKFVNCLNISSCREVKQTFLLKLAYKFWRRRLFVMHFMLFCFYRLSQDYHEFLFE